ncbi:MAG TPA: hypothetical protein VE912_12120 [Bacteroidales bacterium]|nr:hypothetical protein [Bacteroidales bacterium]
MKLQITLLLILSIIMYSCNQQPSGMIYHSEKYTVYSDSVVQPPYHAVALSDSHIISNYVSPDIQHYSPDISFKFSINSRDNEMPVGQNHMITLVPKNGKVVSPMVTFGQQLVDTVAVSEGADMEPDTRWTIRLDMRKILNYFKKQGYTVLYNGKKLYKEDFKGVYVAGNALPLIWDFENLYHHKELELTDQDKDGIYEVTLLMNNKQQQAGKTEWKLQEDLSGLPQYESGQHLINALYNMSLEEMLKDIRPDSTFMAGAKWNGVWTRDISYSILLSLAILQPDIAKNSLMRKVKNDRIIQDTGTGGSWPVSTDRVTWALAAWEVYKVTGDKAWLEKAYQIIRNSVEDDLHVAFSPEKGMFHGESSFLDWREQSYPKWMEPVDIYESFNLGTNAVHYETWNILSKMAAIIGQPADKYRHIADSVKSGINQYLWMENKGYYGQYLYGKDHLILSPRAEALGEALCVLFDIADADQQQKIVSKTPVTSFGIPVIFPETPDIQPYHNNAIWPFVQSFWTLAAAKVGNETAVVRSLAAIYREAALFLTNKENMVAQTGDSEGTAINSDRQLWSVAGDLAMVYKIFYGMQFEPDRLVFSPFVPAGITGTKHLRNFRYRNMKLDIKLTGFGNRIKIFTLDGENKTDPEISALLTGKHTVEIELDNSRYTSGTVNTSDVVFAPSAPVYTIKNDLAYLPVADKNMKYRIYKNGVLKHQESEKVVDLTPGIFRNEYMFVLNSSDGYESFSATPIVILPDDGTIYVEAEKSSLSVASIYQGFSGSGYVELTNQKNTNLELSVMVPTAGNYAVDFHYANGSGPVNTDNKCAIRTLYGDNGELGPVIMPQRGKDEWSNWGYSNVLNISLKEGENVLNLRLEPFNQNMNGKVNKALLDHIRFSRIE